MSSSSSNGDIIRRMEDAAEDFLAALADDQKSVASLDFADEDERRNWHYTPVERKGLMLKDMDGWQVELANRLLGTGLSGSGMHRARTIIDLEPILGEMEGPGGKWKRDPERYYVSVFGTPGNGEWGWRFEGHHVSVNYTIVNGELIGPTPVFLGANPAKVLHGSTEGVRALKEEEDVARDLLASLDGTQKEVAIVSDEAPADMLTKNVPMVTSELDSEPDGLRASEMTDLQQTTLHELIEVYVGRLPDALATDEKARVAEVDAEEIRFAWAGPEARGQGHYYRVLAPTFLAEYDCTQNDANHIHAVWRDLQNDFGQDILRRHLAASH
ncbi:MAG: hypothetical protein CME26_06755 [Gemmatimonadetes bacterium]|nr:hypothetical protein [Gemmatimonadota bacterium]|tara:strand:- start:908 stop:1891 length:984 start_codon:yes stop_codon:yes gene_type:complete